MNAPAGLTISRKHSGSGNWEFIGMNALVSSNQTVDPRLEIHNSTGSPIDVFISTPTLVFGNRNPTLDERPITTSGGTIVGDLTVDGNFSYNGNLSTNSPLVVDNDLTTNGLVITKITTIDSMNMPTTTDLILPQNGSVFVLDFPPLNQIRRINPTPDVQFPEGAIITLLFNRVDLQVRNNTDINLRSGFRSRVNSSLRLISNGDGTWREYSRSR